MKTNVTVCIKSENTDPLLINMCFETIEVVKERIRGKEITNDGRSKKDIKNKLLQKENPSSRNHKINIAGRVL